MRSTKKSKTIRWGVLYWPVGSDTKDSWVGLQSLIPRSKILWSQEKFFQICVVLLVFHLWASFDLRQIRGNDFRGPHDFHFTPRPVHAGGKHISSHQTLRSSESRNGDKPRTLNSFRSLVTSGVWLGDFGEERLFGVVLFWTAGN